tara:strand:- start:1582 stop:1812 length:231 start_codon:yes stop_codon:yes gene_type:complete
MEKRRDNFVVGEIKDYRIFWDTKNTEVNEGYEGGYYYRSDIKDFIQRLKDINKKVVGIVFDDTYNIEFITVDMEEE